MSRLKRDDEYQKTGAFRFFRWMKGTKDPYLDEVEMKPGKPYEDPRTLEEIMAEEYELKQRVYSLEHNRIRSVSERFYQVCSVLFSFVFAGIMLYLVVNLPIAGTADRPVNNEVAKVYIENGIRDTGAVNVVTGMILNYRAFDTFGETCVLFIATTCVMVLLMKEEEKIRSDKSMNDRLYEPKNDIILQKIAFVLVLLLSAFITPSDPFSMFVLGLPLYLLYEFAILLCSLKRH